MFRLGNFSPQSKLLFHTKVIDRWLNGENIYPVLVEFDLTNRCNHRCNFCTFSYMKDKSTIDTLVVMKAIHDFSLGGVKAINWTGGGEPLLHVDFVNIAQSAYGAGIDQGLFTNGALLNSKNSETILKTHSWVRISMDAADSETYRQSHGVNDFDKVIKNVKALVAMKKEMKSSTTIGIGFVITPTNYKEITKFSEIIKDLDVDYGQYKPCVQNFQTKEQITADWWTDNVNPILEKVCEDNPKAVVNLYKLTDLVESNFDRPYEICYGHAFCPCIGASGDVWLCTHLREIAGYSIGNLNNSSFSEIWNGEKRQEVIKSINFDTCQFCCKNNEINKMLYQIKHPDKKSHYNFL